MLALEYLSFRNSVSLLKRSVVTKLFAKREFNIFIGSVKFIIRN